MTSARTDSPPEEKPVVLIVDNDSAVLESLSQALDLLGYAPLPFASAGEALESRTIPTASCILADIRMPGMNGIEFLGHVVSTPDAPPVIMLTGYADVSTAVEAMKRGAYDFLEKPIDNDIIAACVARAVEKNQLLRRNQELARELSLALDGRGRDNYGIIGHSPAIQDLLKRIRQYAQSSQPVLITGETGSGKELVAAAIHRASNRADKPYVVANVGAIPETLVGSELFGHEKGAFTGAYARRGGLFEHASGGVLLLDEIESAPSWLQVQLLRVVENQIVRRVGGSEEFKVDVRVLATTNQRLEERVAKGAFREDLFYRLSALTLRVPSLRERAEDIPELIAYFMSRCKAELRRECPRLEPRALASLQAYDWPGNVRQLQNALVHLSCTNEDGVVREWFPCATEDAAQAPQFLKERIEGYEKAQIVRALRVSKGKIKDVCNRLGIPRKTLYDRLKKYKLDRHEFI